MFLHKSEPGAYTNSTCNNLQNIFHIKFFYVFWGRCTPIVIKFFQVRILHFQENPNLLLKSGLFSNLKPDIYVSAYLEPQMDFE